MTNKSHDWSEVTLHIHTERNKGQVGHTNIKHLNI